MTWEGRLLVDVQVHHEGEWTIVAVVGELDLAVAPRIRHAVAEALGPGRPDAAAPQVILDLASVHFIDSSGLGIVLGVLRRVRQAAGTLRVVVVEPQVVGLFELLELERILDLRPSVPAALAAPVPAGAMTGSEGTSGG